jgi:uncharacterized protein involved in outer membrane biogenesis
LTSAAATATPRHRRRQGRQVLSLREAHQLPCAGRANLGKNKIVIEGTVTDPRAPAGLDLKLSLAGASMADLYPLTGVLLPVTPPYATTGRLIGKKSGADWNWTYKNFAGTVGGSDLEGTLAYTPRKPRPLLTGAVTSRQLRLEDLGPTIGTNTTKTGKALPAEQFNTAKWDALDADVKFSGKTDPHPRHSAAGHRHPYPPDRQSADPHTAQLWLAGGDITSNVKLDGRQKQIDAQIRLAARHLKIRQLFPKLESMQASVGEVSADAALAGKATPSPRC